MEKSKAFDIIMDNRKELVSALINNLEKGYIVSPDSWNNNAFRPHNPASLVSYKGGNRFKLMLISEVMGYMDNRWVTFKQANENGWQIKKGEKGVQLEKWLFTEERVKRDENNKPIKDAAGNSVKETVKLEKPKVNYFVVFNAAQVSGMPELEVKPLQADDTLKLADNLIKSSECPVVETGEGKACYNSLLDKITMPFRDSFKSTDAFLHVLLHEMSHSTGHESRLNREVLNMFGTPKYAIEELNAEISSLFARSDLGIDVSKDKELMQDHTNYIKSWIAALKDDPNILFRACQEADKISNYLVTNYERHMDAERVKSISTDLKQNNFKSSSSIINNIKTLNQVTGKEHCLKDIEQAYKTGLYDNNQEAKLLVKSIGDTLKNQELSKIAVLER